MRKNIKKFAIGTTILAGGLAATIISNAITQPSKQAAKQFLIAQADNSTIAIEQAIHKQINRYRSSK